MSKLMVLRGEEGSVCEVITDGQQFRHVFESKYLGFVLNDQIQMKHNVVGR